MEDQNRIIQLVVKALLSRVQAYRFHGFSGPKGGPKGGPKEEEHHHSLSGGNTQTKTCRNPLGSAACRFVWKD